MSDGGGIERLRFAHPLGHEPLLTRRGHEAIMGLTDVVGLCNHRGPLSVQWVIGIVNDNVLTVMMGSMQFRCLVGQNGFYSIWRGTHIEWPSRIIGWWHWKTAR